MPTWEELQKGRKLMAGGRNSQQMLAARKKVLEKRPKAVIVSTDKGFRLMAEGNNLSSEHDSIHDCWVEASNGI